MQGEDSKDKSVLVDIDRLRDVEALLRESLEMARNYDQYVVELIKERDEAYDAGWKAAMAKVEEEDSALESTRLPPTRG
jgi:hypothetical protein